MQNIPIIVYCSLLSETYVVTDCEYYETIPNGSLSQGNFINPDYTSISSDWSSVGGYSIKVDISTINWNGWRVYNPTISKKGVLVADVHTQNASSTLGLFCRIDGTDRGVQQRFSSSDSTVTINYDFTQYEGSIDRVDVRGIVSSDYRNPIYIDNIRIYPE